MKLYGSFAAPEVQAAIANVTMEPKGWLVYLVRGSDRPRTPAQNSLYRRLLRKLAQQQGQSVEYWHEYLVVRFLGHDEVFTEEGYLRKVLPSTAELTVDEFTPFLNACLAFAADLQVHLG